MPPTTRRCHPQQQKATDNISQRGAMLLKGRIDFIVQGDTYTNLLDERNGLVEGSLYKANILKCR